MSERDPVFGCEIATGRTDKDGYAFHGQTRAHIHAWTQVNGPVPDGMVLDHLCACRRCHAVHHLEPVTQSENLKRRSWRNKAKRMKCQRGHDLKLNGIVTPEGGIVCRQCNKDATGSDRGAR